MLATEAACSVVVEAFKVPSGSRGDAPVASVRGIE
jgi:hypothetical protein